MAKVAVLIVAVVLLAGCQAAQLRAQAETLASDVVHAQTRIAELQNQLNQLPADEPGRAEVEASLAESYAFLEEARPYLERLRERADAAQTDEEATIGFLVTVGEGIAAALGFGGVGLALGSWLRAKRGTG